MEMIYEEGKEYVICAKCRNYKYVPETLRIGVYDTKQFEKYECYKSLLNINPCNGKIERVNIGNASYRNGNGDCKYFERIE
jgi:hypothetical protein